MSRYVQAYMIHEARKTGLILCPTCGARYSATALKRCPQCGRPNPLNFIRRRSARP